MYLVVERKVTEFETSSSIFFCRQIEKTEGRVNRVKIQKEIISGFKPAGLFKAVDTIEDLHALDLNLERLDDMCKALSFHESSTLQKTVNLRMSKIASQHIWKNFSFAGQRRKKPFKDLENIPRKLHDGFVTIKNFSSSYKEIEAAIKAFLSGCNKAKTVDN